MIMKFSIFDLFSIGIGPSSSHTVGPMRAAREAILKCQKLGLLKQIGHIIVDLYGSLALTGKCHKTDIAIMLGLSGEKPENINPILINSKIENIRHNRRVMLLGLHQIPFIDEKNIIFHADKQLPYHTNGMRFIFYDQGGKEINAQIYYSVGGGFIIDHLNASKDKHLGEGKQQVTFPFGTANELLTIGESEKLSISQIMMENEKSWRVEEEIEKGLSELWVAMKESISYSCEQIGTLPGRLSLNRRAFSLYRRLLTEKKSMKENIFEWVNLWAIAVSEENAAGGRVVAAPTNDAAGIIPAVLMYYTNSSCQFSENGMRDFFLTAGAIGLLFKANTIISTAENGCTGEVGVACAMAAAGLTAALGGSNYQIEYAARIAIEQNLGLSCDPILGLVQIPCIERNVMGALKAIHASQYALQQGNTPQHATLDQLIAAVHEDGRQMTKTFKEASSGAIGANIPEG